MSIRQLPVELANQIAAGEVVERPASVVKELIENSLDAGATEIVIDIEAGGRKRIRVRDNGSGIAKDELALALARHATSKISTLDDLEAIYSLGFRGEALASMSSVSRLVLTSKPAAQQQAWQAWTNGRDMQAQIEPAAHPDGTTIDISDLFFNTPARRKFLRTDKTEFGHIDEMVKRIALSRFDVSFQLRHNQQLVRQLPIANTPKQRQQRLAKLCGSLFAEQAQRISVESQGYHLEGWFAPSAGCRHQPDVQYFFVNGRMMRDKLLAHALRQAYEPWLIDEKVPTYVLFLRLPAEQVDVNVHPAKHEVRFHQARQVHDWLLQQVRHGLQAVEQDPSAALVTEAGHHYHSHDNDALPATADIPKPRSPLLPNAAPSRPASQGDWRQLVPQQERQQADHRWQVLRVIQQRFALLIDQQEQLAYLDLWPLYRDSQAHKLRRSVDHGLAGQPLLVPVKLNVELAREFTAIDRLAMERLGIHARQEGRSVVISHVPQMLRRSDVPAMIADLVKQWQRLSNDPEQLCQWLLQRQPPLTMSTTEAEQLVIEWQQQGAPQQWLQPLATPEVTDAAH